MFDINTALKEWRGNFEKSEYFSPRDIEEMESHLTDSIDELKKKSLSEEEAFLISVHRLGTANKLKDEFQKTHPNRIWQNRIIWMLIGFLSVFSLKSFAEIISKTGVFIMSFFTRNFSILFNMEIIIYSLFLLLFSWIIFDLYYSDSSVFEKFIPGRLRFVHYSAFIIIILLGQILPQYLKIEMGRIHHNSYWEVWSQYGGYLTDIYILNFIINLFLPLLLVIYFVFFNRSYKRVNT